MATTGKPPEKFIWEQETEPTAPTLEKGLPGTFLWEQPTPTEAKPTVTPMGTYDTQGLGMENLFSNIFPDKDITGVFDYVQNNPDAFIGDLQKTGWTEDTEAAVKFFVPEVTNEELQALFGATSVYIPEHPFKDDFIDPLTSGAVAFGQDTQTRFLSTLPSVMHTWGGKFKELGYEILSIPAQVGAFLGLIAEGKSIGEASAGAKEIGYEAVEPITLTTDQVISQILPDIQKAAEQNFLRLTAEHKEWWEAHPELTPDPRYSLNPLENPDLLKDPGYWAYSASSSLAYSLSVMGTMLAVSAVATPAAGIAAGIMVASAPEATAMTEELLNQGIPFQEAAQWGELYGFAAGGIEVVSDLFLVGLAAKPFRGITKPFQNLMLRLTANNIVKGIAAGTLVMGIEGLEEAITQAVHNTVLQQYDETQSITEGMSHSFIQGTIASLPFGVWGGSASINTFRRSLSPSVRQQYDDLVAKFKKHGLSSGQAQFQAAKGIARINEEEVVRALEIAKTEYLESQGVTSVEELPTTAMAGWAEVTGVEFRPITTAVGKGYEIVQNDEVVGTVSYSTEVPGVDGIVLDRIDISEAARRQGLATQAIQRVLSEAEAQGVPLYTGMMEADGVQLFNALEQRGIVLLSPAPERMLGELVTGGISQYAPTAAMAAWETVTGVVPEGIPMPVSVQQEFLAQAEIWLQQVPDVQPNTLHIVGIPEGEAFIRTDSEKNPLVVGTSLMREGQLTLSVIVADQSKSQIAIAKALIDVGGYIKANNIAFPPRAEMSPEAIRVYDKLMAKYVPTTAMAEWGTQEAPITRENIPLVINEYKNQLARQEAELARTRKFAPVETSQIMAQERRIKYLQDAIGDLESQSLAMPEGETVTGGEWTTTAMAKWEAVSGKPEVAKPGIVRRADIIKELSERLNVPIRRGHYRGKAVGIYKRGKEIIRLKKGEVDTISHEVGHLLDDRYKLSQHIPRAELPALLKEYTGKPKRKYAEAFAELVRHYVMNPHKVRTIAPQSYKYFTEEFLASNPDIKDILDTARDDYIRWQNMPSTAKIASQLSTEEAGGFKLRQKLSDLYTAAWDDLYPIRDFVKTAERLGVEVAATENPYMLARLLRGKHGRVHTFLEQGTFGKQFWKVVKGKTTPAFTGKSLKQILAPVEAKGQLTDFRIYLVARRALRLANKGIETGIAKNDARAAILELGVKYPAFKDVATAIYGFQASVWQYAYESGLITAETRGWLTRTSTDYVPFYRVVEELQARGYMGKTLANIRAPVHRIKGSERLIIDPLESIVKNTYAIMDAADRNQIGIMLARLAEKDKILTQLFEPIAAPVSKVAQVDAEELGIKFPELSERDVGKIINIFRPSLFYGKDNTLSVLINGKKRFYQVDSDLYKAIMSIEREQAALIVKLLSYPAKWLRAGAVLSPDFWVLKNPLRDTMTAFAYSQYGFMPAIDTVRGLFEFLGKGEAYQMWRMSGGEHAMLVSLDRQYLRKSFTEIVKGKRLVEYVRHPLDALQAFAEFTESATRLGEFKRAIAKGATPVEAGFASREVSLDFACIGAQTKSMNMITAFWNANMRAVDKLVRHATQKKLAGKFYAKVLLGITLPSILLYLANKDDPRWKEIPQWEKDLFWIILTDKNIYRIPKPFELGILFGSLPERILEYIESSDPGCIEEVLRNAGESMNPGFIPTALLPIIEGITNYNFFLGRQIVPEALEDMPPELQYTVYTPEIIKKFGEWANYSPLKIQNLLKGYTAGLGGYVTDALNSILKGTGVLPDIPQPSPTLADYPIIRAIIVRDPYGSGSASVEDFYDTLDELYKGERYLKEMLAKGEKTKFNNYKANHPEVMLLFDYEKGEMYSASRRFLTEQSQILSDLRMKQREIYTSLTMTPEAKRAKIDELNHLITNTARLALEHLGTMPDDFSPVGIVEPRPEEAVLYEVMGKLPQAWRDYLWEHKDEISSDRLEIWGEKIEVWREPDKALTDTYYTDTKGWSYQDKYSYRESHPEIDVALNFWGYVTTIQSPRAKILLQTRMNELGISLTAGKGFIWEEEKPTEGYVWGETPEGTTPGQPGGFIWEQ